MDDEVLGISGLDENDRGDLLRIFKEALEIKSSFSKPRQVRKMIPVSQWIEDEYYVGKEGQFIYPYWKNQLIDIFETNRGKYNEIVVTGGLGTGKSVFANLCMVRKLYELSCYENITGLFDLMPSSIIGFMYFNVSKTQAELTGYGQFKAFVDSIPYFRDNFPRNSKISSLLQYPENVIFMYGSIAAHAIGMNIIGTILDEANFFQKDAQASDKTQNDYQKVSRMYSSVVNRSASRFLGKGVDNSLSILVSSNTTSSSFTEQRIRASLLEGERSHTKVINARLWEVKPEGTYSSKVFWVFKGTNLMDPQIVSTVEDINLYLDTVSEPHVMADTVDEGIKLLSLYHREQFIAVPEDFRKSFDLNISTALQDIAGISVNPLGRLFNSRQTYLDACVEGLEHPFTKDAIVVATGEGLGVKDFLKKSYRPKDIHRKRYIHIDQSTTNDSTGYASSYVSDWVRSPEGVFLPVVTVDLKLRINPPNAPRKISLQKVVDFTFFMMEEWGIEIGKLTQDSFASEMQLQIYQESGVNCSLQSVDRTDEAYLMFTNMLYEGRIRTYRYGPEEEELFDLLHFRDKRKVDHPDGGSKDVMDAVVGSVFNAVQGAMEESPGGNITRAELHAIMSDSHDDEELFSLHELAPGYDFQRIVKPKGRDIF